MRVAIISKRCPKCKGTGKIYKRGSFDYKPKKEKDTSAGDTILEQICKKCNGAGSIPTRIEK